MHPITNNGKKKIKGLCVLLAIALCFSLAVSGCAQADSSTISGNIPDDLTDKEWVDIVVKEINGSSVLGECVKSSGSAVREGDCISFNYDSILMPECSERLSMLFLGQTVRIYYSGSVMETYPLMLDEIYAVFSHTATDDDLNINCS